MFGGRKDMDSFKKELEEELKLSTDDPRSHAWFHGPLSREVLKDQHCSIDRYRLTTEEIVGLPKRSPVN